MSPDDLYERRVLVRTRDAGVHYGTLSEVRGETLALTKSRRIWQWQGGALDCYELAVRGPDSAKLSKVGETVILRGWIEIHPMTEAALGRLEGGK